jgi:putative NADPH-quinone reductase
MKSLVSFAGSPRKTSNSGFMLDHFLDGISQEHVQIHTFDVNAIDLKSCTGCLRCNLLKYCSLRDDDWKELNQKILEADVLVFASPVYFHHLTSDLKRLIDRFRSFIHIQLTKDGLIHSPHQQWEKDFVLLLSMGSPDEREAQPLIDLFEFIIGSLGHKNKLHVIKATGLVGGNQISKTKDELKTLYEKLKLPLDLVDKDYHKNRKVLEKCYALGQSLS